MCPLSVRTLARIVATQRGCVFALFLRILDYCSHTLRPLNNHQHRTDTHQAGASPRRGDFLAHPHLSLLRLFSLLLTMGFSVTKILVQIVTSTEWIIIHGIDCTIL
jgi:hypothetical protein